MLKELRARLSPQVPDDREELLESMRSTRCALSQAYDGFNRAGAGDGDLIESYVYEINALQHRYSYLLRKVRSLEACAGDR